MRFRDDRECFPCRAAATLSAPRSSGARHVHLDARRGSVLVRRGKGGRRREVGMDDWAWEQLQQWLDFRVALAVRRCHMPRRGMRAAGRHIKSI